MEHDDILEKYENKTQLRNDVIDLVRTMSAAYDIYSIAECTERSTQSEMERAEKKVHGQKQISGDLMLEARSDKAAKTAQERSFDGP